MKHIINEHLLPFLGYLAAFLSPVGPLIITMQMIVFSDYLLSKVLEKKKHIASEYSKTKILILICTYIWLILMLRVVEDFLLKDTNAVSNITAGYILWIHLKKFVQNIDRFAGTDLWHRIETMINKIKI